MKTQSYLFFHPSSNYFAKLSSTKHCLNIFLHLKNLVAVNLHLPKIIKNCYCDARKVTWYFIGKECWA